MSASDERLLGAYAAALCDLLSAPLAELRVWGQLLQDKGVATVDEFQERMSKLSASGAYSALAQEIHKKMLARVAEIIQQDQGGGIVH